MRLFQWFVDRSVRLEDTADERVTKEVMVPVFLVLGVTAIVASVLNRFEFDTGYGVGIFIELIVLNSLFLYAIIFRRMSKELAAGGLVAASIGILCMDWYKVTAFGARNWPMIVLVMDCLLAINAKRIVLSGVMNATVVWLGVCCVESAFRLGLWDIPNWSDVDRATLMDLTNCDNPPCAVPWSTAVLTFVGQSVVLYVDFLATRGFAEGMRHEKDGMVAAVRTAERVASLLAAYSVAEAQRAVDDDGEMLPPALRTALELLLRNLTLYRPFLPDSLLMEEDGGSGDDVSADDEAPLVLPQLAAAASRNALHVIVSEAAEASRAQLDAIFIGCAETCVVAGDYTSVRLLLDCGWEAPAALRQRLAEECELPQPSAPSVQPDARRMTVVSNSTGGEDQAKPSRFTDGADAPTYSIASVPLYPAGYVPPSAREAVMSLAVWHDPKGATHWPSVCIDDILADHAVCYPDADDDSVTLYTYTAEIKYTVVWAIWQGQRWTLYADQDAISAHGGFFHFKLDRVELVESGFDPDHFGGGDARLLLEGQCGRRAFDMGGQPRLLRYENSRAGDEEESPLRDTVLWAPHPDRILYPDSPFSLTRAGEAPPPGVLEFITSRSFEERISRRGWQSAPVVLSQLAELQAQCMAQKNQQRSKARLCQAAAEAFAVPADQLHGLGPDPSQLALAVGAAYKIKCPAETPTPAQIAHACEMGLLCWRGRWMLLALTGSPRCAATIPPTGDPWVETLWRVERSHDDQPYKLMNKAIREQQMNHTDAVLSLAPDYFVSLTASQPRHAPPEPTAALFRDAEDGDDVAMIWTAAGWQWSDDLESVLEGQLAVQAWALPQYRGLIWRLEDALRTMPAAGKRTKGYRGIVGVQLDRNTYSRGRVVVFGAFTSTSDDQGVASGFALGEGGAAIFTMFSSTGRRISQWSRYGREQEVLLPPNTMHLVTEALSAEHAAILEKRKLQIFDLEELSAADAAAHLAKEGALQIREHPALLGQAERVRARAAKGDWVGAARELLARPMSSGYERRFQRPVLPKEGVGVVALLIVSPEGCRVGSELDAALWSAFHEHALQKARAHGGHVLATHIGQFTVHVSVPGDVDATARAAVGLAVELRRIDRLDVKQRRQETAVSPVPSERSGRLPLLPPPSPEGRSPRRPSTFRRASCASVSSAGSADAEGQHSLSVFCGVSVGTVHSGFAGSAEQRVEIADGPAVRRANMMAAYAARFGVREVVSDARCAAFAEDAGLRTWITDLVAFDPDADIREPLVCFAPQSAEVSPAQAQQIEDAWEAVLQAAEEGTDAALRRMQECVTAVSATTARASVALHAATLCPATYSYEANEH